MTPAAGSPISRRRLLTGSVAGAGLATGGALLLGPSERAAGGAAANDTGLYGPHQPGIVTPALPYLSLAGFDVVARDRSGLASLLRTWTDVAAGLSAAAAGRLTLTFGFGPALFHEDRFGIDDRRPAPLAPLPPFPGETLDPVASGGDLCVQACAGTPTDAHQAIRALVNAGRTHAALRWRQTGFRPDEPVADPRGMFGFRDGTANLDVDDPLQATEHLWVGEGPAWLHGGTYLVVRRIRLLLDTWDRTDLPVQEAIIGRRRDSNARFDAPRTAHVRLAMPSANGGVKLLRRPYSYDAGVDPNGLMDTGLIFICFQRDPVRQFVPIQQRLAGHDALNGFSQHLASGVFACPPGLRPGAWIGSELLS